MNFGGRQNLLPAGVKRIIVTIALMVTILSPCLAMAGSVQPQSLDYAGIYALRDIDPALTGAGINIAVLCPSATYIDGKPQNDYMPNIKHNCFANQQFSFYDQAGAQPAVSEHATAVCSILFGQDANAFAAQIGNFHYEGAVPQAKPEIYESKYFLVNNVFKAKPPQADIITASFGWQKESWWTRGLDAMAEHNGTVIVAGIGNGCDAFDPLLYPGANANAIGVGVVDSVSSKKAGTNLKNFSLVYPQHSSLGPTADSRCKPDIVAGGNSLCADGNDPNGYNPSGNWSSYSTPIVSGAIAMLIQKAKSDPNLQAAISPAGGNCVMKAIVMNSAKKLPYWHKGAISKQDDHSIPLDYMQGAGAIDALAAYKNLIAGQKSPGDVNQTGWDLNQLQQKNVYNLKLDAPAGKMITVTAAWNKHFENAFPFKAKASSNLRLELWAVDSNDSAKNYLLDYSDSNSDNVEHIYCAADGNYTNYQIVVSYSDADKQNNLNEIYAIAWNAQAKTTEDNINWYDLNGDGKVDASDLLILSDNLLNKSKFSNTYLIGDLNRDGRLDMNDLELLSANSSKKAAWFIQDQNSI